MDLVEDVLENNDALTYLKLSKDITRPMFTRGDLSPSEAENVTVEFIDKLVEIVRGINPDLANILSVDESKYMFRALSRRSDGESQAGRHRKATEFDALKETTLAQTLKNIEENGVDVKTSRGIDVSLGDLKYPLQEFFLGNLFTDDPDLIEMIGISDVSLLLIYDRRDDYDDKSLQTLYHQSDLKELFKTCLIIRWI